MTRVEPAEGVAPPASPSASPPGAGTGATPAQGSLLRSIGLVLVLCGVFLLGFAGFLYGLSGIQEARSQTTMYATLSHEMGNALAPVGPTTPGRPVAVLDIPSAGVRHAVIVEGTSPEDLMLGPGHLRNTPLPGQGGVSEIYGRRATFGAPFSRLPQLRRGEEITVITGQGSSTYRVAATGSSSRLVEDPAPNRLILLTAGSAYLPTYYTYVDADLISAVKPEPGNLPPIFSSETALSGDSNALTTALLWGFALALVSAGATFAVVHWSPWPAYLVAVPVTLAVLWNLYQALAALLPNVY
jgi:sortase A